MAIGVAQEKGTFLGRRKDSRMRSVPRLLLTGLVAMAALMPPFVRAQSTIPAQQTAPGWIFTPSISSGGIWDDNVLLVNPGTNPLSDYGFPITPAASLDYTGKLTRFSTGYTGSFVRYMTLSELDSLQQSFHASVDRKLNTRVALFGQESFNAAPTTDLLVMAGVPFYHIGSRSNAATGGVQAALAKHTTLRTSYTLQNVDFDTNVFTFNQLLGGHTHQVTASVEQAVSRHFVVGGEYEFSRSIVNGQTTLAGVEASEDRFNTQSASGTVQYQPLAGTTISGGLGVAVLGEGLNHAAGTGPVWHAGVSQKAGRGVVSASYSRSYIPSLGFGGTFQNQEGTVRLHMPIGGRAYVDGGFIWMSNEPLNSNEPLGIVQQNLQSAWFSSNVGYHLTRWLSAEGFVVHSQQDSQVAGGQLARNQVGFQVIAAKPIRIR
jgi:hypothetical protein